MRQAWQARAKGVECVEVHLSQDHAWSVGRSCEDRAPGVDDHRPSEGPPPVTVVAHLAWCDDEALILDGARPQENLPMVSSGRHGKRSGDGQDFSAFSRQGSIQSRKAEIITNREAEGGKRAFGQREPISRGNRLGLLMGCPLTERDVKEVDLAVHRMSLAIGPKQDGRVVRHAGVGASLGKGAAEQPHPVVLGEAGQLLEGRSIEGFCEAEFFLLRTHEVDVFGEGDERRAPFCRFVHERLCGRQRGLGIVIGGQLDGCGKKTHEVWTYRS